MIPVASDGSKAPAGWLLPRDEDGKATWDPFKVRLPTEAEVSSWFSRVGPGVAIVCGEVSGNLNVLDIEFLDFLRDFGELVEAQAAGLIASLPLVATPGKDAAGGRHLYFRSPAPLKTGKLARLTEAEAFRRTGDPKKQTAIELKAEGGYVLAPGCPADCHESGRLYRHVGGPFLEEVATLAAGDVELLLSCARALNRLVVASPRPAATRAPSTPAGNRPGDEFNRRASWPAVLEPHGWALVRVRQGVSYWRRPGKERGVSATTGYCTSEYSGDLLCVFSSNAAPLDIPDGRDHQCFSKFSAYALLNHKGDFREATRELARQGYGPPPRHTSKAKDRPRAHISFTVEVR
jgi:putative DNA primase/helicase